MMASLMSVSQAGVPYGPIYGTDANDLLAIRYGIRSDTLYGGAGDDTINTFRGDEAYGGTGDDLITDLRTTDMDAVCKLFGEEGNDTLVGGTRSYQNSFNENTGRTELYGGEGNDKLVARQEDQILDGGTGNDFLIGSYAGAVLNGGDGNDLLLSALKKHVNPAEPFYADYDKYGPNWSSGSLEGGAGNDNLFCAPVIVDTIIFGPGDGRDVVTLFDTDYLISEDFGLVGDLLDLTGFGFEMTAEEVVDTYAFTQSGDTIFRFAPDAVLVLKDVDPDSLLDQIFV